VLNGYQGRHTMYTRDREGIREEPLAAGEKKDVQQSNCQPHLLFGHGNAVANVPSSSPVSRPGVPFSAQPGHRQQGAGKDLPAL